MLAGLTPIPHTQATVTAEAINNVATLPRGACTGTLLPAQPSAGATPSAGSPPPPPPAAPGQQASGSTDSGMSTGAVIGIVVGAVVALGGLALFMLRGGAATGGAKAGGGPKSMEVSQA